MLAGNSSLPVSDWSSGGGNATVILPLIQRPAAWGVLKPRDRSLSRRGRRLQVDSDSGTPGGWIHLSMLTQLVLSLRLRNSYLNLCSPKGCQQECFSIRSCFWRGSGGRRWRFANLIPHTMQCRFRPVRHSALSGRTKPVVGPAPSKRCRQAVRNVEKTAGKSRSSVARRETRG